MQKRKINLIIFGITILGGLVLLIFQINILKVSAQIDSALILSPGNLPYGIVFPQEKLDKTFSLSLNESVAEAVDYQINQTPKPRAPADTDFCRQNNPANPADPNDPYYVKCYPVICGQLSETPDGVPANDFGIQAPHDLSAIASGHLDESDTSDTWTVNLAVPCFEGQCGQDYDPAVYRQPLPASLKGQAFGCDLWVQVTDVTEETTLKTTRLENKDGSWNVIIDGKYAELTYNPSGPTFDWSLNVVGMSANAQYRLVYIPDPWPQGIPPSYNIKTEIKTFTTNSSGAYNGSGSTELNLDLPDSRDSNYGINYAKVWIVPASIHDTYKMTGWNQPATLFDTESVNYDDTDVASTKTITLNDLGASSQYGYYHDYSGADVIFTYTTPGNDKISGTIAATGLKPYATYQLKFEGKPTCKYGASGDDLANEYIGYKGRWWDNTTNSNTDDAGYAANSIYKGGTHCITGYLVWGYITADASGNANKIVTTDSSYHVLWCGGGTCNVSNNTFLSQPDPAHPTINFCAADKVDGQLERGTCGGLTFESGDYKLNMILNEESFHMGPGTWTAVMNSDIEFKIN